MNTLRTRRIVVGLGLTLAGYEALRYAVALAREQGTPLVAVRAYRSLRTDPYEWRQALAWEARNDAARTFAEALGGEPDDLDVTIAIKPGRVAAVLAEVANNPADLLVVGSSSRPRPWDRGQKLAARHCFWRGDCPVIVVPEPALARIRTLRQLQREAFHDIQRSLRAQPADTRNHPQ
jgi:nucleotide-binding universal stress UspA family protein